MRVGNISEMQSLESRTLFSHSVVHHPVHLSLDLSSLLAGKHKLATALSTLKTDDSSALAAIKADLAAVAADRSAIADEIAPYTAQLKSDKADVKSMLIADLAAIKQSQSAASVEIHKDSIAISANVKSGNGDGVTAAKDQLATDKAQAASDLKALLATYKADVAAGKTTIFNDMQAIKDASAADSSTLTDDLATLKTDRQSWMKLITLDRHSVKIDGGNLSAMVELGGGDGDTDGTT